MSGVRDFKKLSGGPELDKVQENIAQVLNPLLKNPLVNGVLLTKVQLANGTTNVEHKLGREPLGWIIVRQDAAALIYEPSTAINKARLLTLISNAATIVDIWAF